MTGIRFKDAEDVMEAIAQNRLQGLAFVSARHDSAGQPIRIMHVPCFRSNVEIAHHAKRFPALGLGLEVSLQTGQPGEFVGVFV